MRDSALYALRDKSYDINTDDSVCISKNIDTFNRGDDIKEARFRGISISCFGDVENKFVLTPKNLPNRDMKYNYILGDGSWGEIDHDIEDILEVNQEMYAIAKFLAKEVDVWIVWPNVDGKGRNSSYAININDNHHEIEKTFSQKSYIPVVLFVFSNDIYDLIDRIDNYSDDEH